MKLKSSVLFSFVFNPILGILFVITPIVSLVLTYFAEKFSIITNVYIVDPSFTPFFKVFEKTQLERV